MRYKLILTSNGRRIEHISASKKKSTIYKTLNDKLKSSNSVKFKVNYLNKNNSIMESKYELLILEHISFVKNKTFLKNNIGKFVEHIIVDNDDWVIIDKYPYNLEETFWVFGYHPKLQRKNFSEIVDMFIDNVTDKNYQKMLLVFKNKLIIKNEDIFEMVICKCVNDSIRLYNEIEKYCNKNKIRNIFYRGYVTESTYPNITKYLMGKTGWNLKKVNRLSTRP